MKPPNREPTHREPTQDELASMAYADGELDAQARADFEARLASEPALGRSVAEYRALELLARQMAPPEPADYEWGRLELDVLQRSISGLGWTLFVVGAVGLSGWGVFEAARADVPLGPKALLLGLIGGALLLLLAAVRARLRVLPYDPYRKVQR